MVDCASNANINTVAYDTGTSQISKGLFNLQLKFSGFSDNLLAVSEFSETVGLDLCGLLYACGGHVSGHLYRGSLG